MEQFIPVFRESVLGGCLCVLLWYVVQNMGKIAVTLDKVSETLLKIDMRVEQLEQRIRDLEKAS